MGRPNYLHYVSSKAGFQGLTDRSTREVGDFNITVNAILPGATVTEVPRETVSPEQMKAMIQARCVKRPQEVSDGSDWLVFCALMRRVLLQGSHLLLMAV